MIAMKIALFTLDTWYLWSQIAVVLCGASALILGKMVNDRQSEKNDAQAKQILGLQTDLEKQREKTALAQKSALETERLIKEPRTIDRKRVDEIVDWGAKGSLDIAFSMIGDEPGNLARQLAEILYTHGWQILSVTPAIVPAEKPGIVIRVYGDTKGIIVATNWADAPEPAKTLHRLLVEALIGNPMVETRVSSDRPKDKLEVTIGGKY
jgi:hypothetical protein